MVNPDTIPRYKEPSGEQLEQMFNDPTPSEVMEQCLHCGACQTVLSLFVDDVTSPKDAASRLQCDVCDEWEPL